VEATITELTNSPDLLITDFHLRSGETGLQVISKVRERFGSNIPVILLSGDTSNRIVLAGLKDTTFFTKPVDVDALLIKIHQIMGDS
jgi:DNA-binding response OmpR family regulator